MIAPRERLTPLATLRLFAAVRIMLLHIVDWDSKPLWTRSTMTTPVGVTFFFVMSGFALTYIYDQQRQAGQFSSRRFYLGRVARIMPVYLLGLLMAVPLLAYSRTFKWPSALAAIGLIQAWFPKTSQFWNYPAWALSAEAFFYILFPALLWALRGVSTRRLIAIATCLWVLSLAPGVLYHWLHPDGYYQLTRHSWGAWLAILKYNPAVRLPEFVLGVIAGKLYLRLDGVGKWATPVFTASALAIFAILATGAKIPYEIMNNGLLAPAIAAAVMALASGGFWARQFSRPTLVLLGNASYCLYLFHVPLWEYVHWIWPNELKRSDGLSLLAAIVIVGVSVLGYLYFEKPVSGWARAKLLQEKAKPLVLTASAASR